MIRSAPLPIVLSGNDNASDDEEISTPSKKPKTPKVMAKGRDNPTAREEEEEQEEQEEQEEEEDDDDDDGSVKVKEEFLGDDFKEA
ncbi:hypothetical protein D6D27_05108 [Aureobasidium pullulans]|nr:hypothetical protein D6D27_05108 [Aureobasidium pullulans]